jgi:heme/copper-type cytochrome/quinol oxidase subunit 2
MPIAVEAVSKEAFAAWVAEAQTKFARVDGAVPATQVASEQSMTQVASEKPTAQLAANVSN